MKQSELINQFRESLAAVSREVEISTAMSHFDINLICENLFCGLFKELHNLPNLRNLNADEKKNYPGIDLADDSARVAIQVTSDKTLEKIKETIKKIVSERLYERYDRFYVYCLTQRQDSYSQASIDKECDGKLSFDAKADVLDYRHLATKAANVEPAALKKVVDILGAYQRGCDVGLAEQDFDPPVKPEETLSTNLVELYLPSNLYIADVRPEFLTGESGRAVRNQRKSVAEKFRNLGRPLPSDFEVSAGKLITFRDLENSNGPFAEVIEDGTAEPLGPDEYVKIDENHERVFKSLLRLCLQQKLYKHRVQWQFKDNVFIFLPRKDSDNTRSESWIGQKKSTRTVFEKKFKRDKPAEIFQVKHFAFSVNFLLIEGGWYMSITPDWFFSWGNDYHRSPYGDKPLSGLKRLEKNRSIFDQFRFLSAWLRDIDEEDLFSSTSKSAPSITFGKALELKGGRYLNEGLWEPLKSLDGEDVGQGSFIENDY